MLNALHANTTRTQCCFHPRPMQIWAESTKFFNDDLKRRKLHHFFELSGRHLCLVLNTTAACVSGSSLPLPAGLAHVTPPALSYQVVLLVEEEHVPVQVLLLTLVQVHDEVDGTALRVLELCWGKRSVQSPPLNSNLCSYF